jgi:flagellar FliL protein
MAQDKSKNEDAVAETPAQKSGKKKGLVLALVGVLVLGVGGGAAWYLAAGKSAGHADAGAEKKPAKPAGPPVFLPLETFTVNLQPEASATYLQVEMSLRVAGTSVVDTIKLYMPEVRSRVLMLLSTKSAPELSSAAGKQKLAEEIRLEITRVIDPDSIPPAPTPAIRKIKAADGESADGDAADAELADEEPADEEPVDEEPGAGTDGADAADGKAAEPAERKIFSVLFTSFIIQ